MNEEIVVVGGGVGGLMVAARVARAGRAVRVLERASRTGGHALSPPVGGVPMNLGAHALYLGGPAERALGELGVAFDGFQPRASDGWLARGDAAFRAPASVVSLFATGWLTLRERFALARFFATLERARVPAASTKEWLDALGLPGGARAFVDTMVRVSTYGDVPDLLPAEIALRQLRVAVGPRAKGVVYVEGGWASLALSLEAVARAAGARVTTDAHVTHVGADGRVTLASGETIAARHVVVALPRAAAAHVVGWSAPERPPLRAACLDLALEAAPTRRLVLGLDEPHYFSVHSPASADAPIRAHALRYLRPGEVGAECKERLERWAGAIAPGLRIAARRFLPELDVMSAVPARDAAPPAMERVSFAGDWTSFGLMLLDAVAESAEAAAARALAERSRAAA